MSREAKRSRLLGIALTLSAILNVFLFVVAFYEEEQIGHKLLRSLHSKPHTLHQRRESLTPNIEVILTQLRKKNFRELLLLVKEDTSEETYSGYTLRDLALGTITSLHHFNFQKPLSGELAPKEERVLLIEDENGTPLQITLFPSLTLEQSRALRSFISEEQYPLTFQGIFFSSSKKIRMMKH